MDFAPYQDENPETVRSLSPPLRARSPPTNPRSPPINRSITGTAFGSEPLPSPSAFANNGRSSPSYFPSPANGMPGGTSGGRLEAGRNFEAFQTSLPMRLDFEAMMAYILLPPAGGVFLLLVETKSDYVR
ncbi:MAG: hypothetical protein M1834_002437 [Cirrosporium novae-zelandiae]|nr:MAG: hypothetical protein M1834_002437 [Cirrosporium novae-zelandiae]